MSQRDATGSQSATSLVERSTSQPRINTITQALKRQRENPANELVVEPSILVNDLPFASASRETVVAGSTTNYNRSNDFLVSKLDRLHDKHERFVSHKEFLQKCLENNVVPKGLKLELEPSIGNHDEEFLTKWYQKLEEFSNSLMSDVISYCDKIKTETTSSISEVTDRLKDTVHEREYKSINETIQENNGIRRQSLKTRKMKKFYALKYAKNDFSRNQLVQTTQWDQNSNDNHPTPRSETSHTNSKPSYANAVKRVPSQHRFNNRETPAPQVKDHQEEAVKLPLNEQISLRRKSSRTNIRDNRSSSNNEQTLERKINELQSELNSIKETSSSKQPTKPASNHIPKNESLVQSRSKDLNTEIEEVRSFISASMQTLKEFEQRFEKRLNMGKTPMV